MTKPDNLKKHDTFLNEKGEIVPIQALGSIAMLAYGYKGLMDWRAKRNIFLKTQIQDDFNNILNSLDRNESK